MSKYTKGPWLFIDATKEASMQYGQRCVIRGDKKHIADFSWNDNSPYFPSKGESQANARLIAAAPDLLEALKEMAEFHGSTHHPNCPEDDTCDCCFKPFNDRINAAIAKAEGKTE